MSGIFQDLRYAVRQLRTNLGFTAVAVLTLALGIGANTGIFTLVNAVLLKSLPVPKPEQLFLVRQQDRFAEQTRVSYPLYKRMLAAMPPTTSLAAATRVSEFYLAITGSQPEMTKGQLVSGNYFQTFETYPIAGRLLTPEDDATIDGAPVAVISYGCWNRRFARDPNVIGREFTINGVGFNVVGVAAPGFFGDEPGRSPEFWLPLTMQFSLHYTQHYSKSTSADEEKPWVPQEDITWLALVGRARNRSDLPIVAGALNQLFSQNPYPGVHPRNDQERAQYRLLLEPGNQGTKSLQRAFSQPLLVLAGMVGIVLLIACANLASLLLARATARTREIAVRLSIGATKHRLVRQLLTECLLLSVLGGLLGIFVAYWCVAVLPSWASTGTSPIPLNLTPDARVLSFSLMLVVVASVLFGLAPALRATAVDPVRALKASANSTLRSSQPGAGWSLRQSLVVLQFALSLVLLVGAALFIRTLRNYVNVNPGFDRDHLLSVWLDTGIRHYNHDQRLSFYQQVVDRTQALPGVRSAALAICGLATNCRSASDIYLPGGSDTVATPQTNAITLRYFQTVGISLLRGREFAAADNDKAPPVAIINQTLAQKLFPNVDPLGRRFGYETNSASEFQIVGVVSDAQVNGVREAAPLMVYFPLLQSVSDVESLDIRSATDPASLTQQVRQMLLSIDPDLPIGNISTLSERVSSDLGQQRLIERLTAIFGGLALCLACLGLYGVMSYTVARKTGELGVRLALGAPRRAVLWLVLHQSLVVIAAGIGTGLLLSVLFARTVGSLLFNLSPYDPASILGAAAVLLMVAIASGLLPAWRAARVNPMEALRVE